MSTKHTKGFKTAIGDTKLARGLVAARNSLESRASWEKVMQAADQAGGIETSEDLKAATTLAKAS
jgi:hypothetical protein